MGPVAIPLIAILALFGLAEDALAQMPDIESQDPLSVPDLESGELVGLPDLDQALAGVTGDVEVSTPIGLDGDVGPVTLHGSQEEAAPADERAEPRPAAAAWAKDAARLPTAEEAAEAAPTGLLALLAMLWASRPDLIGRALYHLAQTQSYLLWLLPGFSRIAACDLQKHPIRAAILEQVRADPGVTIRDIQNTQGIAWGTTVHHLQRLVSGGHLVSGRDGRLNRFWEAGTEVARDRHMVSLLKAETPRRLADVIQDRPGLRQKSLCEALGISGPVASKYLARLESERLVEARPVGNAKQYYPTADLRGAAGLASA